MSIEDFEDEKIKPVTIDKLMWAGLSNRVINCLKNFGYTDPVDVHDAVACGELHWDSKVSGKRLPNFGKICYRELCAWMNLEEPEVIRLTKKETHLVNRLGDLGLMVCNPNANNKILVFK